MPIYMFCFFRGLLKKVYCYILHCCRTCFHRLSEESILVLAYLKATFRKTQSAPIGQLAPFCCDQSTQTQSISRRVTALTTYLSSQGCKQTLFSKLKRLTPFSVDIVLFNFAGRLHAQTSILHTKGKVKSKQLPLIFQ